MDSLPVNKFFIMIIWVCLLISAPCAAAAQPESPVVLVLHSYHKGLGWTDSITSGLRSVFDASNREVDIHYEYMDTKRVYDEKYLALLVDVYRHKYKHRRLDAIISSDDHAFRFLLANHSTLFPGTPVVFCGVNYFKDDFLTGRAFFTGVVEAFSIKGTIDAALRIDPHLKQVYSIVDDTVTGNANKKLLDEIITGYHPRLSFEYIENMDMADVQARVKNLPENSIVLLLHFTSDKSGNRFSLEKSADLVSRSSNRPVFSFWDFHLGHGIIGGKLTTGKAHGQKAAEIVLRILGGESPANIPVVKKSPNLYIFDYQVMRQFGISNEQLPPGSTVINQPVSFYDQHKLLVWQWGTTVVLLVVVIVVIGFNLIKRRAAEASLKKSEERFRDLAELLPETIYEIGTDGTILFVNRSGFDRFGYTPADLANGLKLFDLFLASEHPRMLRNVEKIIAGEDVGLNEYKALGKDGSTVPVMARSARIIRDKKVVGIRGFLIDISEKKRLEEQFFQAQRLESIGTLAGGIAHDFNNLLMGIQGRASLMQLDLDPDNENMEHVKGIEEYVKSAANLTKQLLGFARSGKYDLKATDLNDMVDGIVDMFGRTKKELRIDKRLSAQPATVLVDCSQFEQVVLNLLVNASQAMPAGGNITVSTETTQVSEAVAATGGMDAGQCVKISIADTGTGIDDETRQRIFEPFFSTKERGRGTGLGLASAYGIIKNHNGTITCDSEKGRGTTFHILLPVTNERPDREKRLADTIVKGTETVLLVDDEPMVLEVGESLLKHLGYQVLTASGGNEALAIYRARKGTVDIIILDMIMPDMSGKDTFEQLKGIDAGVKVLLSSGYSIEGEASAILESGCNGFIQKPFDIQRLASHVRDILDASCR